MTLEFVPIPTGKPGGPPSQYLVDWAPHWLPFLPHIAKRTKEPVKVLIERILRGEVQVALVWDGAKAYALIGIQYHKRGDDLIAEIIWLTGTGMKRWLHLLSRMEQYLKEHMHCVEIRPICRPGWARMIKGQGYRITHFVMAKTL